MKNFIIDNTEIRELLLLWQNYFRPVLFDFSPFNDYSRLLKIPFLFSYIKELKTIYSKENEIKIGKTKIAYNHLLGSYICLTNDNNKCVCNNLYKFLEIQYTGAYSYGCENCFIYFEIENYEQYFFDDFRFGLQFKIKKIIDNFKFIENDIKIKLYPLFIKYINKLEGHRQKRFKRNYYLIFKRINILKSFINDCIKGYENYRFSLIYFLYYFPEIKINKFESSEKSEDKYISKLSTFFNSYKWITIKRPIITEEEEQKIFETFFNITTKKIEKNIDKYYYKDNNNIRQEINIENIKYIDKRNKMIYCIFDQDNLIIFQIINEVEFKCKKIFNKRLCIRDDDCVGNEYKILGIKMKINRCHFGTQGGRKYNIPIKKMNNFIYIIYFDLIFILDERFNLYKLINYIKKSVFWTIPIPDCIYQKNNILLILGKVPNCLFIFNYINNQLVSKVTGLSGNYVIELKNSNNLLIIDGDKLIEFNYIKCCINHIQYFHELYLNIKGKNYRYYKYKQKQYKLVYKDIIIKNLNCLELKYIFEHYKNIKYDYIVDENNNIITVKK